MTDQVQHNSGQNGNRKIVPTKAGLSSQLTMRRLCLQEHFGVDARLSKDRAESSFGHVTWMVWERDLAPCRGLAPDFVATGAGPIKRIAARSKFVRYVRILEPRKSAHLRHSDGYE